MDVHERRVRPVIFLYLLLVALLAISPISGLAQDTTPTPTDVATDTPIPTETATDTPIPTDTPTETSTPEPTATNTPEATATDTPAPTDTATNVPAPTATNTPQPTATPASLTVISDADTYVSNSASTVNTNYGTMTNLLVDGSPQQEGLVRFTVGGIQGGVVSAKLRLYVRDPSVGGPSVYGATTTGTRPRSPGTIVRRALATLWPPAARSRSIPPLISM